MKSRKNCTDRHNRGSAVLEFGPCLIVLLLFIFFPFVNLLMLGLTYSSIAALNYAQLREAAVSTHQEALDPRGRVLKLIPEEWQTHGFGARVVGKPATKLSYEQAQKSGTLQDELVIVSTSVTAEPFLKLPFFPGIPALGAPVTLSVSTQRLVENTTGAE